VKARHSGLTIARADCSNVTVGGARHRNDTFAGAWRSHVIIASACLSSSAATLWAWRITVGGIKREICNVPKMSWFKKRKKRWVTIT
jgi:hypothetical protein